MKIQWIRQRVRDSMLLAPLMMLLSGIALAVVLLEVDKRWEPGREFPFVFDGGVEAARPLLSTIATATLTAATLVFSITMLVLQLASGQFSPRVLGTFLRDRYAKYSLASSQPPSLSRLWSSRILTARTRPTLPVPSQPQRLSPSCSSCSASGD